MAKWPARWTRSPVASPSLATSWICSRSSQAKFKSLVMLVNSQLVASCQLVIFNKSVSKYLSGVPVNWLDKLSALPTINKPLNLFFLIIENICLFRSLI